MKTILIIAAVVFIVLWIALPLIKAAIFWALIIGAGLFIWNKFKTPSTPTDPKA